MHPPSQDKNNEQEILNSWHVNASVWISAIRNHEIESRVEVTNKAIINLIKQDKPNLLLDIGCGEGWLCHALEAYNVKTVGVDAIPTLIDAAKSYCQGTFYTCTYNQLTNTLPKDIKYDAVVCNFSLIGHHDVDRLIQTIPTLLKTDGYLYIQTLHPLYFDTNLPYKDGWREGSWKGLNSAFTQPVPWYFRTIENWKALFLNSNLKLVAQLEPKKKVNLKPSSIIFKCEKN